MSAVTATSQRSKNGLTIAYHFLLPLSFFFIECFAFYRLALNLNEFKVSQLWPLAFGGIWAILLSSLVHMLPAIPARITYGILYFAAVVYAGFQTGYYVLFSDMMWLTDFRHVSEGADYADVLLTYPKSWWLGLAFLIVFGVLLLWKFPKWKYTKGKGIGSGLLAVVMGLTAFYLPRAEFQSDSGWEKSDYSRMESTEAAYKEMFNAHRLYQVCGLYQTAVKDISAHYLYPMLPGAEKAREAGREEVRSYFAQQPDVQENQMSGLLQGRNVILVLMESMDDWMITEDTPTLQKLMSEGINFTRFYTPVYGGIRTFNTEFCINTGSFLSSAGGFAFDYVTNGFDQSLANRLRNEGYSAKAFHYNLPSFYSRGAFMPAIGYEAYVSYDSYIPKEEEDTLYDDQLVFDNPELYQEFFRQGQPTLNFLITRSAHLSYKYNEVLSHWALKKYPDYRGLTGNEETDCALLKARLVDDLFARLLKELEAQGQLHNTVIIGVTDHYTYGYKNTEELLSLSGVQDKLLLEKTPAFIWSSDLESMEVDKVLNTADLLPTVLNLLGVEPEYDYMGSDAFDESYEGFVPFSNGSWIAGDTAFDASTGQYLSISGGSVKVSEEFKKEMNEKVQTFTKINNLILDTDFYKS